jgi:GNAT superfamily N-acetyltransferase
VGNAGPLLGAADRNFAEAWRAIVALAPRPGVVDSGEALLLSSGEPVALFNPVFVRGPVADPAGVVGGIIGHYAGLGLPFALYFREEVSPGLAQAAAAGGLTEHWSPPLMALDPIPRAPVKPVPDELTALPVEAGRVDAYLSVLAEGFGMPREVADRILKRALTEVDGFTGVIGLVDGEPVAVSGVFVTEGVAGIYNVATIPDRRGKGYGAALTWEAAAIGRGQGATRSILQSSEAGEPVYRGMGFTTPARYRQFEGPPAS